ncbi:PcfJ domain-containing protein [Rhizobium sp. Leaf383]|uniref:PcfJ domain-containing protein n=1 Tax=Rhizobium sp. Leaf383 TaxID=1736357 RepID=UPI000715A9FA|nr:PcfJ domain-containing protein [Rhizobium sp. Leaf383]KQS84841.1 hypothetical protein ASG58_20325 [Rhizobium sp. Leaf383]
MRMTHEEEYGVSILTNIVGLRHSHASSLFECSVGRLFVRHVRCNPRPESGTFETTHAFWAAAAEEYFETNRNAVTHVCDWLSTAVIECYPWLMRQDDQQRPVKLMKAGSLERLVHEADKAEARLRSGLPHYLSLSANDERYERELGAGYTLVRLLTRDALDVESERMRHCIGNGAYDENLSDGGHLYYSVRDEHGQPKATLEIVAKLIDGLTYGEVRQFQGRANRTPDRHVVDLVDGIMTEMSWIERSRTKATADDLRVAFLRGSNLG